MQGSKVLSRSSKPSADALASVIAALGARGAKHSRVEAAGHWALSFPSLDRLKFVALLRGRCCVILPGGQVHWVEQGDVFLLGRTPYVVASDTATPPLPGSGLFAQSGQEVVRLGGDRCVAIGGSVALSQAGTALLLDALPPFLHIGHACDSASAVRRTLGVLEAQSGPAELGGSLIAVKLAEVLLIEALRAASAHGDRAFAGWVSALGDRQVGQALRLMHGNIAFAWTVAGLAERVAMSRSAFAQRFAEQVGRSPMDYLRGLRMALARQMLSAGGSDVAAVAAQVGYASQSAFGQAFRRAFGHPPTAARDDRDAQDLSAR